MGSLRFFCYFITFLITICVCTNNCLHAQLKAHVKPPTSNKINLGHVSSGEGKVLPKDVFRGRVIHAHVSGSTGFDEHSKHSDLGLKRNTGIRVFVSEFGLTDRLSIQMLVPYVYLNQLTMDQNKFVKSQVFNKIYNEKINDAAKLLQAEGLCESISECSELIERDFRIPLRKEIKLPTGETQIFPQGSSLKLNIVNAILSAATPPEFGATGLGDIETGVLYNLLGTDKFSVSTGLGMRFNTGNFHLPESMRPSSGGVKDLGLRLNIDYSPFHGFWISTQKQMETALSKSFWRAPSLLNPENFADTNPSEYNQNNLRTYSKEGWSRTFLLKGNYGFGAAHSDLKALAMSMSYEYSQTRVIKLNEKIHQPKEKVHKVIFGGVISGLPYRFPLEIETNYRIPFHGENVRIASSSFESSLKFFAKF